MDCKNEAVWWVQYGPTPDDYTESCSQHLGELAESCVARAVEAGASIELSYGPASEKSRCCWTPQSVVVV